MRYFIILLAAALVGCRSGEQSHHNHEGHEGHNHEGHNHGHEGHNHNHETAAAETHGEEIILTREQAEAAHLAVETATRAPFAEAIHASGRIEAAQGSEAIIAAPSSGIVTLTRALTEGSAVAKGQSVATISARGMAGGDVAANAAIEYETAAREYQRAENLVKDQIISQKEFEAIRQRHEAARGALPAGATTQGVVAGSPIAGYLKNLLVAGGEYVAVGQPIATVSSTGRLQLRAEVSERYYPRLAAIEGANFRLASGPDIYRAGRPLSYGKSTDGAYVPVIFDFANTGAVASGAWAEVWLLGTPREGVISLPKSALTEEQGLAFVYVQLGGDDYARREVTLGADNGERVEIVAGIHEGDKIVTRGAMRVRLAAMSSIIPEGHSHTH